MKLVSYRHHAVGGIGLLEAGMLAALTVPTLHELLASRPPDVPLQEFAKTLRSGELIPLDEVQIAALSVRPGRNVFAVGWNYTDHFAEGAAARNDDRELPAYPTFFTKTPQTVIGPFDPIVIDTSVTHSWDYEVEVAIVLASGGRNIPLGRAEACIAGFTLANDVTARDLQRRHGGQWFKGKSIDDTCPLGPAVITPDELPGGRPSRVSLSLNGQLLQSASISDMYFDFPRIIAELSVGMVLNAGDVILTGTPSGVGYARRPPVWLAHGDEVVVSSPELGELRNTVVDLARAAS